MDSLCPTATLPARSLVRWSARTTPTWAIPTGMPTRRRSVGYDAWSSGVGRSRWRATIARPRASRLRRSPTGSGARRRRSRPTSTTHLTLTKGLRKPRRDARRVWRPPAHKADPGLSRAERTPPWRGGASPTPDPVRRSSARQGRYLSAYASRRSAGSSRRLFGAHNSAIAGGHGHAVGATIATVAKRKPASTVEGEQSDRRCRPALAGRQTRS